MPHKAKWLMKIASGFLVISRMRTDCCDAKFMIVSVSGEGDDKRCGSQSGSADGFRLHRRFLNRRSVSDAFVNEAVRHDEIAQQEFSER